MDFDATDSLIQRCAEGDRAAFRSLYDLWGPRLHGIALRITGQPSAAADATHDAFLQLWRNADRFNPARGAGAAFLVTLIRYRALDIVRRSGREILGHELLDAPDQGPDAFAQLSASAEGDALRRCLELLDADRRRLVILAFVEGLSHADLSARLSQPLGTIKSTIRRSLRALRECLAP